MTTTYDIAPMPDESRVVITFKGKSIGWLPVKEITIANVIKLCAANGHSLTFSQAAFLCRSVLDAHATGALQFKQTPIATEQAMSMEGAQDISAQLEAIREALAGDPRINAIAYTKKQVATALNVSERTIDRWSADKHDPLPRIRNGHKFLYRREALIDWLKRHESPTKSSR